MSITSPRYTFDVEVRLDMVRLQLNWLQREMAMLRQLVRQEEKPDAPQRTFKSLRGVWAGVEISDQDIEAARITLPEELS